MATFTYWANSENGENETGRMEADNQEDLILRLRQNGKFCYRVREESVQSKVKNLKLREVSQFCRQLASMLSAGINLSQSLNTMYRSNEKKRIRNASLALYESVLSGQSLSQSIGQLGKTFPELLRYMIETGEASGSLDEIMESMAVHYDKEYQLRKKIINAMIYPIILAFVAVSVVIFMVIIVLPQFVQLYQGVELPLPTKMLLAFSEFFSSNFFAILIAFVIFIGLFLYARTIRSIRKKMDKMKLKIPIFGKLNRTIITSRFASTYSILYSSGISILQSTEIVSKVMNSVFVEDKLIWVSERLQSGNLLSKSLEQTKVFDPMMVTMVSVGEESGTLDEILKKTGKVFREDADIAIARMVALIEPIMIIVLGSIMLFIVLAIILPVFNMYNQIM